MEATLKVKMRTVPGFIEKSWISQSKLIKMQNKLKNWGLALNEKQSVLVINVKVTGKVQEQFCFVGVCTDTDVIYQGFFQKLMSWAYESQI